MKELQLLFREEIVPSETSPNNSVKNKLELTGQIKFSSYQTCLAYDYFKWKTRMKEKIAASIYKMIYGDILYKLERAQHDIIIMRYVNPHEVDRIFSDIRNSIPKITYDSQKL